MARPDREHTPNRNRCPGTAYGAALGNISPPIEANRREKSNRKRYPSSLETATKRPSGLTTAATSEAERPATLAALTWRLLNRSVQLKSAISLDLFMSSITALDCDVVRCWQTTSATGNPAVLIGSKKLK